MGRPQFEKYRSILRTELNPGQSVQFTVPEFKGILKSLVVKISGDATADVTGETVTLEKMMDTVLATLSMKNGGTIMKDEVATMLFKYATHLLGGPSPYALADGGSEATSSWLLSVPILFCLKPQEVSELMGLNRDMYQDLTLTVTMPTNLAHVDFDTDSMDCQIIYYVVSHATSQGYITYEGHQKTFGNTDPFELRPSLKIAGGVINKIALYGDDGSAGNLIDEMEIWEGTKVTYVTTMAQEQGENMTKYRISYRNGNAMNTAAYLVSPVHEYFGLLDFDLEDDIYGSMEVEGLTVKMDVQATERLDYQYIIYVPYIVGA